MRITAKMEKDLKGVLDLIESVQKKYDGIYITADHTLNERSIVASVTVSNNDNDFSGITKWSNGEYTKS